MGKFSIDDLKFKGPSYRSQNGETLSFRVWMGHCMMTIYGPGRNQKPLLNKALKEDEIFLISKYMTVMVKAEPGKEYSLVYNTYDFKEKKRNLDYILILKKDEKRVYHIVIKANGQTYDFPIRNINAFSYGTGEIPDDEKSANTFLHLIHHLKNVIPLQTQLSSFPIENQGQGNSGGYRQGNRGGGNSYGGQGDFQSSNKNLPPDDDIFSAE